MKKTTKLTIFFLFFMLIVFILNAQAHEKKLTKEEQEAMKIWTNYVTPGESHKHLEYFIGEWESMQKIFSSPDAPPLIKKQDISVKSLLGGLFLQAEIKIEGGFMGKSAEGIVITGYNNYKKEFFALSISSLGSGYTLTTGTLDNTGKIRTETGVVDNIITGEKQKVKAVSTIINEDKYTYEYYYVDAKGKETKKMEISYYRKK